MAETTINIYIPIFTFMTFSHCLKSALYISFVSVEIYPSIFFILLTIDRPILEYVVPIL